MNPKIELTSVLQAIKVAEHRSFRRGAEALGVCQSSISKRVRKLEEVLGVDLFDRHHAGVKVTNAGRQFFEHIKMALDHIDSAVSSAGMAGRVEKGSLRVGLFSSLASGFLPELLRCYSVKHPGINISIVEGPPSENLTRLRADELDIVFVMGQPVARDCDGLGQGISLMNEAIVAMPFPHVSFRPVAGNSDVVPFSGVWLLRNSNQALRRFISLARTLSKTWNAPKECVADGAREMKGSP